MIKKTEIEIMKNWAYAEPPLLSVAAITYNHEDYISEALDSMLMQKTDFPFEIIVHDDCSTDNTVNILKAYAKKYPNIIKLILQKENQYSQGKKIVKIISEKVKGTYIAWCEGDDYWIDAGKLQTQIGLMKQNPECDMSFHPTKTRFDNDGYGEIGARHAGKNKIFTTSDVIIGGGGFCPSASIVIRKEVWSTLPSFFDDAPVGDYFVQIFGSLNGGALYIDKVMSVYRQGIATSWSSSMIDIDRRVEFYQKIIKTLDKLDIYLDHKYKNEIAHEKSKQHYHLAVFYLYNEMFDMFKYYMQLSYKTFNLNTMFYTIDYKLRFFPRVLLALKNLKSK
mgnify:CR=1 FL=1